MPFVLFSSGGAFLMVDIMRQPDETLTDYHVRSQRDVDHNWVGLTPEARAPFTDHMLKVSRLSFPECKSQQMFLCLYGCVRGQRL